MKRGLALIYGVVCYCLFFGTFLYAIGFVGNVGVPKSIDSGPVTAMGAAVLINAALLGLFAVQHSVMARRGFKQKWTQVVSWYVERSTYVLMASLVLDLLLWQWRPIPQIVWDVRGTKAELPLVLLFWLGWGILLVSTFLINHFELFGLAQVWAYFRGQEFHRPSFKIPGFYRFVRHPIYLGFVIAFWAAPVMTVGHLLFTVACTGYIFVGAWFEERDLISHYGNSYLEYRSRVPMLIPFLKRPRPPQESAKSTVA